MRKLTFVIAIAALFAVATPTANAAKRVRYEGKTTGGHKITFSFGKGRMWNVATGVPMTCLSIQGGGAPITGVELWSFKWVKLGLKNYKFSEKSKPSLYYGEVTRNHTVSTRRAGRNTIKGAVRVQYSFLVPRYIPGTFSIYSCLGNMKFTAKPAR